MAVNQNDVVCNGCIHNKVCGKKDKLEQIYKQVRNFVISLEEVSGEIVSNKETTKLFKSYKSYEESKVTQQNGFKVVVQCKDHSTGEYL